MEEKYSKLLLTLEWVILALSIIVLVGTILLAGFGSISNGVKIVIIVLGCIPSGVGLYFCMKIEQLAGFYLCEICGHKYIPTFRASSFSLHCGRTKYMTCPECYNKSWQKKVIK